MSCVNDNSRFSRGIAFKLGVSDFAEKRMGKRDVKGANRVYSNIVEGSILVMMMARHVGFATVASEFVSIRFRLFETAALNFAL